MTDPVGQNWAKLLPEIYEMPAKRQAPFWAKPRPKASKPIIHGRLIVAEQPDYESEGRRFESCRAHHFEIRTATMVAVFFVVLGESGNMWDLIRWTMPRQTIKTAAKGLHGSSPSSKVAKTR